MVLGFGLQSSTGPVLAQSNADKASVYEQLDLFGDIFERIRAQYVEEVDDADLIEAAINGMLTSLDPHSSYLSPKDAEEMRFQTKKNQTSVKIIFRQADKLWGERISRARSAAKGEYPSTTICSHGGK